MTGGELKKKLPLTMKLSVLPPGTTPKAKPSPGQSVGKAAAKPSTPLTAPATVKGLGEKMGKN